MSRWKDTLATLHSEPSLLTASAHLTDALCFPDPDRTSERFAAAHIRAVRKRIEAEHGITSERVPDWHAGTSDERILWGALYYTAQAEYWADDTEPHYLRLAEAALRTLWRRGQS